MEKYINIKKIWMLVFGIFVTLTCGISLIVSTSASDNEHIHKNKEVSLGVVLKSFDDSFTTELKYDIEVEAMKKNVYVQVCNSEDSVELQCKQVKELVRSGINILAIEAVNSDSRYIKAAIRYAMANDVKVIQINNKIKGYDSKLSYIGFDNMSSGKHIASDIVEYFDLKGYFATDVNGSDYKEKLSLRAREEKIQNTLNRESKYDNKVTAIYIGKDNNSNTKEYIKGLDKNDIEQFELLKAYIVEVNPYKDEIDSKDIENIRKIIEKVICDYGKVDSIICNDSYINSVIKKVLKSENIRTKDCSNNVVDICVAGKEFIKNNYDSQGQLDIEQQDLVGAIYKDINFQAKEIIRIGMNLYADADIEDDIIENEFK